VIGILLSPFISISQPDSPNFHKSSYNLNEMSTRKQPSRQYHDM
jgi:hypothetical protein